MVLIVIAYFGRGVLNGNDVTSASDSTNESIDSETAVSETPVFVATPVPATPRVATVQQYASIVAGLSAAIRENAFAARQCSLGQCSVTGYLKVMTLGLQASTLHIKLTAASEDRATNGLFIGAPPQEVARLVAETIEAAADMKAAVDSWNGAGCPGPTTCSGLLHMISLRASTLVSRLDSWRPYGA